MAFRAGPCRTGLSCLVLVRGKLAIYWPARRYGFVDCDDNDYVFNKPKVRAGLSWWRRVWSFVDQHAGDWHPLRVESVAWISERTDVLSGFSSC